MPISRHLPFILQPDMAVNIFTSLQNIALFGSNTSKEAIKL